MRSGFLNCVWFNQPYLARVFKRGQRLIVHGKVQPLRPRSAPDAREGLRGGGGRSRRARCTRAASCRVYPLTEGLTQRPLRRLMKRLVDGWADRRRGSASRSRARGARTAGLPQAHRAPPTFPRAKAEQAAARRRARLRRFLPARARARHPPPARGPPPRARHEPAGRPRAPPRARRCPIR